MKLKKIAVLSLAALLALAGTGCGVKKGEGDTETTASAQEGERKQPDSYGTATLGEYKGIELPEADTAVTDAEVEEQIKTNLTFSPDVTAVTDRPVKEGDTVNIDYKGTKDGVAFDGGSAEGFDLVIGSHRFIDGFEEGLVGHSIGETVTLNLTFPEDYKSEELKGQAVVFEVKINAISVSTPAQLTDEWVVKQGLEGVITVDQYRAYIRENMEVQRKQAAENQDRYNALMTIMDSSTFELNQEALDYEFNTSMDNVEKQVSAQGINVAEYAAAYGMTEDQLKDQLKSQAENYAKQMVTVSTIFDKEKMELTDADYNYIVELNGGQATKEELVEQYGEKEVENTAKTYKVLQFIIDNAKRVKETQAESTPAQGAAETSTTAAQ